MQRYHPLLELAPRDVVSRSIASELRRTGAAHVYLDLTHLGAADIPARFPRIYETCLRYGVDLKNEPGPVHPAAHYAMGGVRTDLDGRASLPGLFAACEAACAGVHGANRLASNSLLEGVVFGARAGRAMRDRNPAPSPIPPPRPPVSPVMAEADLRRLAWEACGIVRNGDDLRAALTALSNPPSLARPATRAGYEARNIHTLVSLIARCALARQESRGGHYRSDYPEKQPAYQKHSIISLTHDVRFE